ncbi:MAG: DUF4326 domain-containing protein [Chloroflexi bacterium]|nr:DUF4326 domain-containing protein [Chloroflexota bacterium]
MIKVGNVKQVRDWVSSIVYVGRPMKSGCEQIRKGSILGNPFRVGRDGSRSVVIEKYRKRLWGECQREHSAVKDELLRLVEIEKSGKMIVLVCWCHPQPCHADVIKRAIEFYVTGQPQTPKPIQRILRLN